MTVVVVGQRRREIGIVRWSGDKIYALHNRCPHHGGPLCHGTIAATLSSSGAVPAGVAVDDERPVVVCPWHHWEFVASTGECLADRRIRSRTYRTRVLGGRVYVDLPR